MSPARHRVIAYAAGVVMGLTLAALMLVALPRCARAEESVPDITRRDHADWVLRLYVKTRTCMRSAGVAAFRRQPEVGAAHAQLFMTSVCADPMRVQLQIDGMPEWQSRCILARIARTTYYEDVLRVQEPAIKPGDAITCDPTKE